MPVLITLDLPSELEDKLSLEVTQLKLPLTEYILRVLLFRSFLQNPPKTGAELVSYWEGSTIALLSCRMRSVIQLLLLH
jgi:hypothetical protein